MFKQQRCLFVRMGVYLWRRVYTFDLLVPIRLSLRLLLYCWCSQAPRLCILSPGTGYAWVALGLAANVHESKQDNSESFHLSWLRTVCCGKLNRLAQTGLNLNPLEYVQSCKQISERQLLAFVLKSKDLANSYVVEASFGDVHLNSPAQSLRAKALEFF